MTTILHYPKFKAFAANGITPLAGGKVYTYDAGTTNPKTTYTDNSGSTANANPVILDSRGEADIWGSTGAYKVVVKTSADVTLITVDNITVDVIGTLALSSGSSLLGYIQSGTGAVATTVQTRLRQIEVTVKEFGATGDGTTDDTASIQLALNKIANGGTLIFPTGDYKISAAMSITLNGYVIIKGIGATITSIISDASTLGIFTITGASTYSVKFDGLVIKGTASVSGGVSGVKLISCKNSTIENCETRQLSGNGIFVDLGSDVTISNNVLISNKTSGIYVTNTSNVLVDGNYVEDNGVLGSGNGYGITMATSTTAANKNIIISNNKCINPIRKGIDIHSGIGVLIVGNYVVNSTGLQDTTSAGIYAVSESTSKDVRQVMIHDNYIDGTGSGTSMIGISVGTSNDSPGVATAAEFFSIKGNVVRNCNNTGAIGIYCAIAAAPAVAFDNIVISNNQLINACGSASSAVFIQNVNNAPDRIDISDNIIVCVTTGTVIRVEYGVYVKIINNIVRMYSGTSSTGIYTPASTTSTLVENNQLSGTFTTTIFSTTIEKNNTINGVKINSKGFNGNTGLTSVGFETTFEGKTAGSTVTLDIANVTTPIADSNVFFYIEIVESQYNNNAKTLYEGYIWGRYVAAAFENNAATVDVKKTITAGGTPPTIAWVDISGVAATLRITLNPTFSGYYIRINGTTYNGTIILLH